MTELETLLQGSPYRAYTYAYPHKTAYRPFDPPLSLADLWAHERRDALFLYVHVPFCEMRCGFCNLFTTVDPQGHFQRDYLAALERQARQVRAALGPTAFARMAIGGGTPTMLDLNELAQVFDLVEDLYGVDPHSIPVSVETSPKTAEPAKLRLLRSRGVDRISIGVQSFVAAEVAAVGRAQSPAVVAQALAAIRDVGVPTLNIDLMYGLPHQTEASWLASLEQALRFTPEELYLYPLYVRPLTGLSRQEKNWDDLRLAYYRVGRERLLAAGYTQVSLRMFRAPHAPDLVGPVYCCQEDGMVGLGCGARSYTSSVHYSSDYAVGATGVRSILRDYLQQPASSFANVYYGIHLDAEDQRRRFILQSLLQAEGLWFTAYETRFGSLPLHDLPELIELTEHGLAVADAARLWLTPAGLERSDLIGPWLYPPVVRTLMEGFTLR